jgi:aldose 1-epimerase
MQFINDQNKPAMKGKQADMYELNNKNNARAAFTNYGARLTGLWVPDKNCMGLATLKTT